MSGRLDVSDYRRSAFQFSLAPDGTYLEHNYNRDLHLFVIWQDARAALDQILNDLARRFSVLSVADVQWSESLIVRNSDRLYKNVQRRARRVSPKIGRGRFNVVIVEDPDPRYGLDLNASGIYEIANQAIVRHKRSYRTWFETSYAVHSTSSMAEFFEHAPLLLGLEQSRNVIAGRTSPDEVRTVHADTTGVRGWGNFKELFRFLNLATNAIVLSDFECLPDADPAGVSELEFLCEDLRGFLAAINADMVDYRVPFRSNITVGGHTLSVVARHIGDGHLDARWQRDLLANQCTHGDSVPRPRPDDHFFYLLYRTKIHGASVDNDGLDSLAAAALEIGLEEIGVPEIESDESAASILAGFMKGRGYKVVIPEDPSIRPRSRILRHMRDTVSRESRRKPGALSRIARSIKGTINRRSWDGPRSVLEKTNRSS